MKTPSLNVRFCDEWNGGFGWIADEPAFLERASHAVLADGGVWVVDPVDGEGVERRIRELGEPAGVLQLLDRHARDGVELAARLGVPHHVTPFGGVTDGPFEVITVVRVPRWHEIALWFPQERVLACADALGSAAYFGAPGEAIAVHPFLRLVPPRQLGGRSPLHLLVGHGEGVHGERAEQALEDALSSSRRRAPGWLLAQARRGLERIRS